MTRPDIAGCRLSDGTSLASLLDKGYRLTNYSPGRIVVFAPPPYGGSVGEVLGPLADELGKAYDPWNYRVCSDRLSGKSGRPGMPAPTSAAEAADAIQYWRDDLRRLG